MKRKMTNKLTSANTLFCRRIYRAISLVLAVAILAGQTFGAHRAMSDLASEAKVSLNFWLHSKGYAALPRFISGLQPTPAPQAQEKQTERDTRVSNVTIYPESATLRLGEREFFGALVKDDKGETVGGASLTWQAFDLSRNKTARISQTGEFVGLFPGNYQLTVEAAGHTAQAIVTVLKDDIRPNAKAAPVSAKEISSREIPSSVAPPKPVSSQPALIDPEPGPGWDAGNFMFADDPDNGRGNPPGRPLDDGAGSGNFGFAAPAFSSGGRGIDISLNLVYNSRLWSKTSSEIFYDLDRDWPAPGWSFGFGRIVGLGSGGAMIVDADGTRHSFNGTVTTFPNGTIYFTGRATDGTFIDYISNTDTTGTIISAQAKLPNGTVIDYGAPGRGCVYPMRITDANGNYLTIQYRLNGGVQKGPKIQFFNDTLNRTIEFHYGDGKLTSITAPDVISGTRTLIRLHYTTLTLNYGFSGLTPRVENPTPSVIDAIYYPGTGTGYWFGDSNSYSSYGMLAKVIEQRGMIFAPGPTFDDQGTISPGMMTNQSVYDYPLAANPALTDAPTYSNMTETWDSMDTSQAITSYFIQKFTDRREATITLPDGSKSLQKSYNYSNLPDSDPNKFKDGLVYEDSTTDTDGTTVLRKSNATWEKGAYDSPRPVRVEGRDEVNQVTAAEFEYGPVYNQVHEVRDYGYGGTTLLRKTVTNYRNGSGYINQHIFNIVQRVDVFASDGVTRVSRIEYSHDETTLANTPNVVQHDIRFDPYTPPICQWEPDPSDPDCIDPNCNLNNPFCDGICTQIWVCSSGHDPATNYRGNVTSVIRYAQAANLSGAITETRTYDITGNLVTASTSCCEQTSFTYTSDTQYAYPTLQTRGAADPNAPARISISAVYDFNTGLTRFVTDANGRVSETQYFQTTLRPQRVNLPTGAFSNFTYDDTGMSVSETAYTNASVMASQTLRRINGRGQIRREEALGQNNVWDIVETKFDKLGRVSKQTRPFNSGIPQESETAYDGIGRVKWARAADGSQSTNYYNEATRPSSASALPGQTIRSVDAWGRERWTRFDADGRLAEVVEPNPSGNGSVFATGNMVTTYGYDTLGNLTSTSQGVQQRSFKYDSLSRLTHQKLVEENATLNDSGTYVGSGQWSEAFAYDERSNLIMQTEARGVKTNYVYNNDPLNRLQSISYDTSGFGDTTHALLPAAQVSYEYTANGDKTRLFKVTTSGISTEELGYDVEGRVISKTVTLTSRPNYPIVTDYIYDSLNRVQDVRYPAEYAMANNPRKLVHHDFDISSRLSGLKVDGTDYASQINYNAASQTTSLKVGASGANQITENFTYDAATGLLTNQTVQRGVTTLLDLSYDYLRNGTSVGRTGQVTKIFNNLNHNRDRGYQYDALGRLITATGGTSANWTQQYVYDRYGNRTSVTATGSAQSNAPLPNQPPTVSITAPENGATFNAPANITINANASDSDGTVTKVEFFSNGTKVGEDTKAPYSFTWSGVAAASYALTAKATDNAGATTTSAAISITVNAAGNTPPTVNITSPANGATFTAPANIPVSANASDSGGSVTQVEFFAGSTSLGVDTTAPYSVSWNNVVAGSYALTARATDNQGATTTSSAVNITVNSPPNQPPSVSITAPANGAQFTAPANIAISANASDSDGSITKVEFFQGTTLLATDTTVPYSFTWSNAPAGSYSLTAKATDNGGAITTSAAVNVTVNPVGSNQPPTATITLPPNNSVFTAPAAIGLKATASDSDGTVNKVEFFANGNLIGTDTTAPYSYTWINVPAGSYTFTARATDNGGATGTSAPINVTVNGASNTPPTVGITAPANGAQFTAPANITVSANASDSDGNVTQVEFFANGVSLGIDTTAPYSINWNNVAAGGYSLTARATDNGGAVTTSSAVSITVNPGSTNQPPSVTLTQPANGAQFTAPASITVSANANDSDGSVAQVEFFANGNSLGIDLTAPYSVTWNNVAAGSYALTASATDNQGAMTTSAAVSITVTSGGGSTPIPRDGLANVTYDTASNRINSAGWEYDAAGNQTRLQRADGSWQRLVYDAAGRMVKVTDDLGTTIIIHTYGASNHRLIEQIGNESSNNRIYYAWDGDSTIAEYEESASNPTAPRWTKSYVYLGARLLATLEPNGASEVTKFHHPDRLGTRLVTSPADGSVIEQATLPFGTALDAESTGSTKRRFTSYDRSTVSGLDYAVNRHYDSLQGRFTQVDSIGMNSANFLDPQSFNLYAYVGNDPINRTDPSGLLWGWLKSIFKKVIQAFFRAVVVAVVTFIRTGSVHLALAAGAVAFLSEFTPNLGWLPSSSQPTFGSGGPTLFQIFRQSDIGSTLFPDYSGLSVINNFQNPTGRPGCGENPLTRIRGFEFEPQGVLGNLRLGAKGGSGRFNASRPKNKSGRHLGLDMSVSSTLDGPFLYGAYMTTVPFVFPSLPGKVEFAGDKGPKGTGLTVIINHGGGLKTLYGHLAGLYVKARQDVALGDVLGIAGQSGNAKGQAFSEYHLHFEIRLNGKFLDPASWLRGVIPCR